MNHKTVGKIAIIAALVAVLALPVLAEAGSRNARGAGKRKNPAASARVEARKAARLASKEASGSPRARVKAQRRAQLQARISNKLAARKRRFDAANANLNKRIDRIAALTARVAAAGGDVSEVNAKLDIARQHLANALALEQEAIAKFRAIPTAPDRKAAFREARAKGREAVADLKLTRTSIRDAAVALRVVVKALKASGAVNGQ